MTKNRLCVGFIMGAHGVRGCVKLRSLTEDPDAIFSYKELSDETGKRLFKLTRKAEGKDHFIVSIDGVTDRDVAQSMARTKLFIARDVLPKTKKHEYYQADLVGLDVRDEKGSQRGKVLAVHDYGAGAFLEIAPLEGKSFMLPFKDAYVPTVDVEAGFIQAVIPEEWLAQDDEEKPDDDGE